MIKEVKRRNTSMYIQLAEADLGMYQATGERFYLERAMEILRNLNKEAVKKWGMKNE